MSGPTHVQLAELSVDDAINMRRTGRGVEPQFAASIRAKGVITPLVVRSHKGDGYTITNGSKRFDALMFLKEKGETANGIPVTDAYPVPIIIRQENDLEARDTSLITNIVHAPPHPVDCYEAFAQLLADGRSIEEIAGTYAMTKNQVEQTLALGRLSPTVRKAWRDGEIKEEHAQAFTMAASHKQQDDVLARIKKRGELRWGGADHRIRGMIVGDKQGAASTFVTFVGIEAYEAAGGKVVKDLFKGQHGVSDPALAKKLADEKLAAKCAELVAAGWAWAKPDTEVKDSYLYGSISKKPTYTDEEKAEIVRLEGIVDAEADGADVAYEELERIQDAARARAFKPAERARSGCLLEITQSGKLKITYGLIPPQQRKDKAGSAMRALAGEGSQPAPKPKPSNKISAALERRLEQQLDKATKAALGTEKHPTPLYQVLAACVANQIDVRTTFSHIPHDVKSVLPDIRNAIQPAVMKAALIKAFDTADYFKGAPAKLRIKALEEMEVSARPSKAGDLIKLCTAEAEKRGWFPPQLRTAHYDGPGAKAKAAGKSKKR